MGEQFASLLVQMTMRPAGRLFARLLALTLISSVLAGALLLGQGIAQEAARAAGRLGADIMIVPHGTRESPAKLLGGMPVAAPLPTGIEARLAVLAGVSLVAPQYLFSSAADPCCDMGNVLLVGFDPDRDLTVLPWLTPADGLPDNEGQLLAGSLVMKAPGATMRFFDHTLELKAHLEKSGTATFDKALFIPKNALAAMERSAQRGGRQLTVAWDRPSLLLLRLEPSVEPRQLALALEQQFPDIQALPIDPAVRSIRLQLEQLGQGQRPLAAAAWLFALFSGGTLLFAGLKSRQSSLGLLYAYGWSTGLLALMTAVGTFCLALVGAAAGGLAAFATLRLCAHYLAMATGLPLLAGGLSRAAITIAWTGPVFAAALGIEAAIIALLVLREDAADLLRGNR